MSFIQNYGICVRETYLSVRRPFGTLVCAFVSRGSRRVPDKIRPKERPNSYTRVVNLDLFSPSPLIF